VIPADPTGEGHGPPEPIGDQAALALSLLREAAEWRFLGLLFERPRSEWHEELRRLSGESGDDETRAIAEQAAGATEELHLHLIGPGGLASPREAAYRCLHDPGWILADLKAFHEAFAFKADRENPPDHAACLASLAGYLKLKEAYALASREDDAASLASRAFKSLIADHLRWMAEPMAARLAAAGPSYLAKAARLLADRAGPAPEQQSHVLEDGEDSPACGPGCLDFCYSPHPDDPASHLLRHVRGGPLCQGRRPG
jgi:hypothetical protein